MNRNQIRKQIVVRAFAAYLTFSAPLFAPAVAFAADASPSQSVATENASNRMANRLGFSLGVGEPSPALLGLNVSYNLFDFMRLTAGYGSISVTSGLSIDGSGNVTTEEASAHTVGAGAKFFVPGWSITPTAGLHFGTIMYSGREGAITVGGFDRSGSHVYMSVGADWQTKSGFSLGAGYQQSFRSGIGGAFYGSLGWYFNWLG